MNHNLPKTKEEKTLRTEQTHKPICEITLSRIRV